MGKDIIKTKGKFVIGMVHCLALPGTWRFDNNCDYIIKRAIEDAVTLEKSGVDGIMVENMCDNPLPITLDIEQSVALASIVAKIKEQVTIPVGIDAAFCDYKTSLSIAKFNDCDFVRIPVFVDRVQFHGGIIEPCARECVLYREKLKASNVKILADIQVKHTNLTINIPIEQSAKLAQACGADAVIVTGSTTGESTPMEMIEKVKKVVTIPVIVGSGIKASTIKRQLNIADGTIVGTSMKLDGKLDSPIDFKLAKEIVDRRR